jgi:hypothetical protein
MQRLFPGIHFILLRSFSPSEPIVRTPYFHERRSGDTSAWIGALQFRRNKGLEQTHQYMHPCARVCEARLDLLAATLAGQAPRAKMLAIIRQQAIAVFTEAGASTPYSLGADVPCTRMKADCNRITGGKAVQRDFNDGTPAVPGGKSGIVNNPACAGIDAVVFVATTARHEVRTGRYVALVRERNVRQAASRAARGTLPFDTGFLLFAVHGSPLFFPG